MDDIQSHRGWDNAEGRRRTKLDRSGTTQYQKLGVVARVEVRSRAAGRRRQGIRHEQRQSEAGGQRVSQHGEIVTAARAPGVRVRAGKYYEPRTRCGPARKVVLRGPSLFAGSDVRER